MTPSAASDRQCLQLALSGSWDHAGECLLCANRRCGINGPVVSAGRWQIAVRVSRPSPAILLGRGVNKSSEAATSLDALPNQQPLIHSDIGAPDDAAVVVVLLAKKRGKILPAKSSREETKLIELGFERRLLHRRAEPLCELGNDRSRRVRRRKQAP